VEEEPHPTSPAIAITIKTRDVLLPGISEPLQENWKFQQV